MRSAMRTEPEKRQLIAPPCADSIYCMETGAPSYVRKGERTMARTITVRPATISPETALPLDSAARRKVAAYARVSTDHEEQESSFEAQCAYYANYIKSRPDWEYAGMYADEGISGLSTKHRDGFNRMVKDALDGKIDLILTKSVSRFARNVVDSLSAIRELKARGTEVYFEKENIWTFDGKGELLISIMSSLSQEESRSISENVKWGHRKKFESGRYSLTYSHFLGYDKGEDGNLVINEEQAPIVRRIYSDFLLGLSVSAIARKLTDERIPTPAGKEKWSASTVRSILRNEKYEGSALLQKTFTADFLTKKTVKNQGELPQYFIEEDHEAIIDPAQFALVQEILADPDAGRRGSSIFAGRIRCGACGSWYGPKVWHSTDPYRRVVWQCSGKYRDRKRCGTPHLTGEQIRQTFIRAMNKRIADRSFYLTELRSVAAALCDTSAPETERRTLDEKAAGADDAVIRVTAENAGAAQDESKKHDAPASSCHGTEARRRAAASQIEAMRARLGKMMRFIQRIEAADGLITEFSPALWAAMVDAVTVEEEGMVFTFTDGTEIRV